MKEQDFDRRMRDLLSREKSYDSDWKAMSERWKASEHEMEIRDEEFDEAFAQKISGVNHFSPMWDQMAALLKITKINRRNYWITKSLELIVLLMLSISFHDHWDDIKQLFVSTDQIDASAVQIEDSLLKAHDSDQRHDTQAVEDAYSVELTSEAVQAEEGQIKESEQSIIETRSPSSDLLTSNTFAAAPSFSDQSASTAEARGVQRSESISTYKPESDATARNQERLPSTTVLSAEQHQRSASKESAVSATERYAMQVLEPLSMRDVSMLTRSNSADLQMDFVQIDPTDKAETPKGIGRLTAATELVLHWIQTPAQDEFNFGSYDHSSFGSRISLGYEYAWSRWSVSTGLEWESISYDNRNISRIVDLSSGVEDFTAVQARNLRYDIVNLPLEVRYAYTDGSQSKLYLMAGLVGSYVMDSSFDLTEFEVSVLSTGLQVEESDNTPVSQGDLDLDFADKSYFSTRIGIGTERNFLPGWSYGIQASFQYQLGKGIGPSQDKIHGFGLKLGVKRSF